MIEYRQTARQKPTEKSQKAENDTRSSNAMTSINTNIPKQHTIDALQTE
jgi:hypothetical protein